MADRTPLKATFFAFQKREGAQLFQAGLAYVISLILIVLAFGLGVFALFGAAMLQSVAAADESSSTALAGSLLLLIPLYIVFLFGIFVLMSAFEAGCLRWLIRGEKSAPFGLHFGKDMWRAYGTYWCWVIYAIVGGIGFFVVTGVLGMAASAALGQNGALLTGFAAFAYLIVWFYATVRLAPAAATCIAIGRFAPLKAWSATQSRFWPLLGSFVLLFLIYLVFFIAAWSVQIGAMLGPSLAEVDWSLATSDPQAVSEQYEQAVLAGMTGMIGNPTRLALYLGATIVMTVGGIVFYQLFYGVNARAAAVALEEGKIAPEALMPPSSAGS
jgi:hypothetical protein